MKEFLFLLYSIVGVVQTREVLQATGITLHVGDIPRGSHGDCGSCIQLTCPPSKEIQWVTPGLTKSIYYQQDGVWRYIAYYRVSPC